MKSYLHIVCVLFLFLCVTNSSVSSVMQSASGIYTLVRDQIPQSIIVLSREATETEEFAAKELQYYLYQVTGLQIPVLTDDIIDPAKTYRIRGFYAWPCPPEEAEPEMVFIHVGRNKWVQQSGVKVRTDSPFPDPFVIRTLENQLFICGAGDRGTLYGVYKFLQDYIGCRWYLPGELGEYLPRQTTITVPSIDRTDVPSFSIRVQTHNFNKGKNHEDWSMKNGCQILLGKEARQAHRGGSLQMYLGHALADHVNPEVYFNDHPEYFALVRGRRLHGGYDGWGGESQPCTTNPEVLRVTITNISGIFETYPGLDVLSLCPNDNMNFSEDERALALDGGKVFQWIEQDKKETAGWIPKWKVPVVSDRVWAFVNAVAEHFPEKTFYVFAYHNYVNPPSVVMPRSNVICSITHFNPADYAHAIEDPRSVENTKFREMVGGWFPVHDNFMFYAYTCKTLWQQMPFPVAPTFAQDVKWLHRNGITKYYSQSVQNRWGQIGVHLWVIAQLLWDVNRDSDELMQDYFDGMFGPASSSMFEFYMTLHRSMNRDHVYVNHRPVDEAPVFLTPEVIAQAEMRLEEAFAASSDEKITERIRLFWVPFIYAKYYVEALRLGDLYDTTKDIASLKQCVTVYKELITFAKRYAHLNTLHYVGSPRDVYSGIEKDMQWHYGYRKNQLDQVLSERQ